MITQTTSSSSLLKPSKPERMMVLDGNQQQLSSMMTTKAGAGATDTHCPSALLDPTPIDTEQVNVVKEIKLGSIPQILMKEYNDSTSAEILHELLLLSSSLSEEEEEQYNGSPTTITTATALLMNHQASCSSASSVSSNASDVTTPTTKIVAKKKKNDEKWDQRFQELLEYRKQYGNVLVPHDYSLNKPLGQWVKRQRYQISLLLCEGKRSTLTDARMRALAGIGFVGSKHSAVWEEKFLELEEFHRRFGHCNVPSKYPKNKPLSIWVRCQRRNFRQSVLSKDRMERLQAMGFDFNPRGI